MEGNLLYARHYNQQNEDYEDTGEKMLSIYQGIYQTRSTNGYVIYPTLKYLGSINVTRRIFYKGQKFSHKIVQQNENSVVLFSYNPNIYEKTYYPLGTLLHEHGYSEALLEDIIRISLESAYNPQIKTHCSNYINGEINGIVAF